MLGETEFRVEGRWRPRNDMPLPPALVEAIINPRSVRSGGFSSVIPVDHHQVVKLVTEEGAMAFLEWVSPLGDILPGMVRVDQIWRKAAWDRERGMHSNLVVMELLYPYEDAYILAGLYKDLRWSLERRHGLEGQELRVATLKEMAFELENNEDLTPERVKAMWHIPEALCALAHFVELQWEKGEGFAVDLENSANWMVRGNGQVVICDPGHAESELDD